MDGDEDDNGDDFGPHHDRGPDHFDDLDDLDHQGLVCSTRKAFPITSMALITAIDDLTVGQSVGYTHPTAIETIYFFIFSETNRPPGASCNSSFDATCTWLYRLEISPILLFASTTLTYNLRQIFHSAVWIWPLRSQVSIAHGTHEDRSSTASGNFHQQWHQLVFYALISGQSTGRTAHSPKAESLCAFWACFARPLEP